ncbi:DNA segregation ATPase FtsK/SpoIIIE, S-DNA-T family [Oceanobacillus limi]|uniref:DNA segregation ATPase FtsK/SpoIIIE, S-DNA-T family n=1 Tax=Oceanobacillus limi TaxID=930131 RepID=A0A1I0GHN4_9BACI|nr:FtsK/SpoIIIE domain-containing protein [Oceanobacillus limi]SET69544.1 DNA segregation ATPase FtsK/SpoIIIE, S-DNA-T family [Oceanobacillus limi]
MFSVFAYTSIAALTAAVFMPETNMSYKRRLSIIFRRTGFLREYRDLYGNLKQGLPKYLGETTAGNYAEYSYSIPLGNVLSESLEKAIVEAFDVPVKVYAEGGRLYVRFYNENLPENISYAKVPNRGGYVVPIGKSLDGWLFHNFDKTPHMTVAGATRQGKTVFLKNVLTYLSERHGEDIRFYMIDLKGGLEFGRYAKLPQVVEVASDASEAAEVFTKLRQQMNETMAYFRDNGYTNIVNTPIKQRTFIIIDEAAQLTPEPFMDDEEKKLMQYCQWCMAEITRIAGALGWRLIHATQYPTADSLPRAVKQNADAKMAFRLPTELASRVAIDENGAEYLPNPGRGIYRTVDRQIVQVPYLSDEEMAKRLKLTKRSVITWGELGERRDDRVRTNEVPTENDRDIIEFE